jgi:molybdopterin-guanine dinucleotide biosynthesis protein
MNTIYCTDFETMSDTIDILLAEGYKVALRYSDIIINNTQAYEITYKPDGETNTEK